MDSIDLDILKYVTKRDNYDDVKDVITKALCTKESWTLLGDIGEYYKTHPDEEEITKDFKIWMRTTRHPGWKTDQLEAYGRMVDTILANEEPDRQSFLSELVSIKNVETFNQTYQQLKNGDITVDEGITIVSSLNTGSVQAVDNYSLEDLAAKRLNNEGYYWRLEDLNKALGPLGDSDFVIVAKRPEIGGTSFLVSELGYMIDQLPEDGNVVIFNNEEAPDKVYSRMVSSCLGIDYRTLMSAPNKYQKDFEDYKKGRRYDLIHDTSMTIQSIRRSLKETEYSIIGINVLLKVGGTGAKEDHDKFQALGEECRRIAQEYGPVIAIVQADPSAEGMRYIPQDRIYKSKTALQGEADALIMIGKDENMNEDERSIYVAKNKLPPAACTVEHLKHIKTDVQFDTTTGRFTSNNFKGNSRDGKAS